MDFTHILTDLCTMVLTALLAVGFVVLLLYYGLFFLRVGRYKGAARKKNAAAETLPPVSVVMAAQNDGESLRSNLVYLLEQDYPAFAVVVAD